MVVAGRFKPAAKVACFSDVTVLLLDIEPLLLLVKMRDAIREPGKGQ
jgi:hypothetical protein